MTLPQVADYSLTESVLIIPFQAEPTSQVLPAASASAPIQRGQSTLQVQTSQSLPSNSQATPRLHSFLLEIERKRPKRLRSTADFNPPLEPIQVR
jgi:hypothetical protein